MATKNYYFGAGGTAGGAATSFATRTSSLTQLKAVMLAGVTSGDDVILWGEGLICRETHSSWAAVGGTVCQISSTDCIGQSLRIASYSAVDSGQTPLTLTDFYLVGTSTASWTDTGTTTTKGTKIWVSASALTGMANGVGRVFGANYKTDPAFNTKELWEGGNNYSGTLGAAIHQNLDVIPGADVPGNCWTCYNSSGVISTSLYIACAVNPYTAFGTLTVNTRGVSSVLGLYSLSNLTVDPEVTVMGGGVYAVRIDACGTAGPCLIQPAILCSHPYGQPIYFTGVNQNIYLAPYIDPMYDSVVPYYAGVGTGHDVGGNQIGVSAAASFAGATGWPEDGGIPGIVIKSEASNGRKTRIVDLMHAGIYNNTPSIAGSHKYFRIEDGVEFDFSHVRYGRAFGIVSVVNSDIGAINVTASPSPSQYVGIPTAGFRIRGARLKSKNNVGDMTPKGTPWGPGENKTGTSCGLLLYTGTGYTTGELLIEDCVFECQDGGLSLQVQSGVSWAGKVRVFNCVFIRPGLLSNIPNLGVDAVTNGILAYIATTTPAALPDLVEFVNCVAIGYGPTPVRYISVTPAVNNLQAIETMTVGVNTGWTLFETYEAFRQALSSGQLPHIKA